MTVTIRPATTAAEVHVASWRAAYRGLVPARILDGLSVDAREQLVLKMLSLDGVSVWVADVGGRVDAFASFGPARGPAAEHAGELYVLYAHERAWGSGLGRALLSRAVDELTRGGFREAVLWVLEANERARRFYERHGWTPSGERRTEHLQDHPLDEVQYRRRLQ